MQFLKPWEAAHLVKHLKNIHDICSSKKRKHADIDDVPAKPKGSGSGVASVSSFFKSAPRQEESLPLVASQMVAHDGIPIRLLATSTQIRKGLIARGFANLPSSATTFRTMIMGFHGKMVKKLANTFKEKLVSLTHTINHICNAYFTLKKGERSAI